MSSNSPPSEKLIDKTGKINKIPKQVLEHGKTTTITESTVENTIKATNVTTPSKYSLKQHFNLTKINKKDNNFYTILLSIVLVVVSVSELWLTKEFFQLRMSHDLLQSQVLQINEELLKIASPTKSINNSKTRTIRAVPIDESRFFERNRKNCDCKAGPVGPPGPPGKIYKIEKK